MSEFRFMYSEEVEELRALIYELREIVDTSWVGDRPVCDEEIMAVQSKMLRAGLLGNRYVRSDSCPYCGSGRRITRFDFSGERPVAMRVEADHDDTCPLVSQEGR